MNQHWHWQTEQDDAYLTCDLLSSWRHGFFTSESYPQTPSELTRILKFDTEAYRVKQIHGNAILTPQEITTIVNQNNYHNSLAEADAIVSDRHNQSVWVASADCTPLLIGDVVTGRVAAIHAGWRGTALKIATQAVTRFLDFGSKLEDLRVALGPAISGIRYQVDDKVAIAVGSTIISHSETKSHDVILSELQELPQTPIQPDELPGKVRLDVALVNQIQLEQLGIGSAHIAIAPYCTYDQEKSEANGSSRFFSYRRTGAKKVQWSGIVSQQLSQN